MCVVGGFKDYFGGLHFFFGIQTALGQNRTLGPILSNFYAHKNDPILKENRSPFVGHETLISNTPNVFCNAWVPI